MQTITINDLNEQQIEVLKTFKKQGATKEQIIEYAMALYCDVDIDIFDISLSAEQMREIRLGENEGIDTTIYTEFDADKMHELRYGLICSRSDKRDIKKYISYETEQIKVINDVFNEGFQPAYIGLFDNIHYSADVMIELKELVKEGYIRNISDLPTDPSKSTEANLKAIEEFKANIGMSSNKVENIENIEVMTEVNVESEPEFITENIEDDQSINEVSDDNIEPSLDQNIFDESDELSLSGFNLNSNNSDDSGFSGIFDI